MSEADRQRWDATYAGGALEPVDVGIPAVFSGHIEAFPTGGVGLDVACGRGGSAVWLALRGLTVCGVDVSPVALAHARTLAERRRVTDRCRFAAADLDDGLPDGDPADAVICHRFRAPALYGAIVGRLAPGGVLAVSVLSEVGSRPGRFRAAPGELATAFADLESIAGGEGGGIAWLIARKPAGNAVDSTSDVPGRRP